MSVQPGVGFEALEMPDVEAGIINHLKARFAAEDVDDARFTERFPLDPVTQLPLVLVTLTPGGGQLNRYMVQARVEVQAWATPRAEALALAGICRRALVKRGGFRLDANGVVSRATANPLPHRVDSGDAVNRVPSYLAGYDLLIRLTQP